MHILYVRTYVCICVHSYICMYVRMHVLYVVGGQYLLYICMCICIYFMLWVDSTNCTYVCMCVHMRIVDIFSFMLFCSYRVLPSESVLCSEVGVSGEKPTALPWGALGGGSELQHYIALVV